MNEGGKEGVQRRKVRQGAGGTGGMGGKGGCAAESICICGREAQRAGMELGTEV